MFKLDKCAKKSSNFSHKQRRLNAICKHHPADPQQNAASIPPDFQSHRRAISTPNEIPTA